MDTVLDWLTTPLGQAIACVLLLIPAGVRVFHAVDRRRQFKAFAARHGMQVVGTIAPDGRAPYDRFEHLRWSVLIHHTLEGEWEALPVAVFDANRPKHPRRTAAIVIAPSVLVSGEHRPVVPFDRVEAVGQLLYVRSPSLLQVSALPGFLSQAVALARTLADEAGAGRSDGVPTFR